MYSSCLFSESNSNRSITKPEVSVASCKIKNTELIKRAFFQNVFEYEPAINFLSFLIKYKIILILFVTLLGLQKHSEFF
ncbi:unnamed protein product [Brassica napus]|uniref:(rape) hypothetical protein n=1 Tax=Brassica napus TaxID=3708 RepID=A0A816NGP5_BRANA|nr:unnamed protein product [Brassica napus]